MSNSNNGPCDSNNRSLTPTSRGNNNSRMVGRSSAILFPRSPLLSEYIDDDNRESNALGAVDYVNIALSIVNRTQILRHQDCPMNDKGRSSHYNNRDIEPQD